MTEKEIAFKYVHGHHDALTDNQEKKDMANDIINFAENYFKSKQCKTCKHLNKENNYCPIIDQFNEIEFGCINHCA